MPPNTFSLLLTVALKLMVVDGSEKTFSGYHFMDNQLEDRFGPDNGYATYNTGVAIPDQVILSYTVTDISTFINTFLLKVSICFKAWVDFDRYGYQIPLFEIFRLNETNPSASFLCKFLTICLSKLTLSF